MFENVFSELVKAISDRAPYRQLMTQPTLKVVQTAMNSRLIHKQQLRGGFCAPATSDSKKKPEIVPIDRLAGMHACESVLRDCDFQFSPRTGRISIGASAQAVTGRAFRHS
jgi:hypothetical protein